MSRPQRLPCRLACIVALLPWSAQAQIAPFAVGVTQTVRHEDNLFRAVSGSEVSDWISSTAVNGEYAQEIGRQKLSAAASVSAVRYRHNDQLNSDVYRVESQLDWSTVGLLSGTLGGDLSLKPYEYGQDGELPIDTRNLERNEHLYLSAKLGGVTALTFTGGLDYLNRRYSNPLFDSSEQRQWAVNVGALHRPSPDLTLGLTLRRTEGRLPNALPAPDRSSRTDAQLTGNWQATGASNIDASFGYTVDEHTTLTDRSFWNGAVKWTWRPTGRLTLVTGLRRDASDSFQPVEDNGSRVLGASLRSSADLSAVWEVTSKIRLTGLVQQGVRDFSSATLLGNATGKDTFRTLRAGVTYELSRSLQFGCELSRDERRVSGTTLNSRPYDASTVSCNAQFWLR